MLVKKVLFLLVIIGFMTMALYAQNGTIVYTLVMDGVKIDPETGDYPDMENIFALEDEGYEVVLFYEDSLSTASQATLDTLNNANLVIIGRSCPSVDFQDPHKQVWNDIPTPMICLEMWALRNTRMNWFNTETMVRNTAEQEFNAIINVPEDPVFDAIGNPVDPVPWMVGPFDAIGTTDPGNGTNMAMQEDDSTVLFVRFEPGEEFYPGSGDYPAEERVMIGNGNDNSGAPFYYFNWTIESLEVFFAEVARLFALGGGSAVDGEPAASASTFVLAQNYPNPFNPTTTIPFDLPESSHIRLSLSNILGEEVTVIADGEYSSGHHEIVFDAGNLTTGVYIYKLETEKHVSMKKLAVVK